MNRSAFTLIEMLVVIAIIAVLASILIPTISLVKRMVNEMKCGSQLQQIAAAIEVYKHENEDRFPEKINDSNTRSTSDLMHSGGPLVGLAKILLCPLDGSKGTNQRMGRHQDWDTGIEQTNLGLRKENGSSYLYEDSREPLTPGSYGTINFFYKDLSTTERPQLGSPEATWAAGKYHQLRFGNLRDGSTTEYGARFPAVYFPIIRCFHHYKWQNKRSDTTMKKVNNVSWDLNVFSSTPYWEHDANPAIPLPNFSQ